MITALLALLSSGWAWALALGWLVPAGAALAAGIVATVFGGDWWLALIVSIGIGGFVLIWIKWGLAPALAWLAAASAIFIDQRAAKRGAATQAAKEKADADRNVQRASAARIDADRRNADTSRLRDDDGFRRD